MWKFSLRSSRCAPHFHLSSSVLQERSWLLSSTHSAFFASKTSKLTEGKTRERARTKSRVRGSAKPRLSLDDADEVSYQSKTTSSKVTQPNSASRPQHKLTSSNSNSSDSAAFPRHTQQQQQQSQQQQHLQQPQFINDRNPFAKPLYVHPAWESETIEKERQRAEKLLSKHSHQLELEEMKHQQDLEEQERLQEALRAEESQKRREERKKERVENKTRKKKIIQLFKNGLDGVTDTETLNALFAEAGSINIQEELRKGAAAFERYKQTGKTQEEEDGEEEEESDLSGSDVDYDSDGEVIIKKADLKEEQDVLKEMEEQQGEEEDVEEGIEEAELEEEAIGQGEIHEPDENETEEAKDRRIENEKRVHEMERFIMEQEFIRRDLPHSPLKAAENSVLVGDVFMPWPFKPDPTKLVRVAVLGTPNSGKSSLVNALTGTKVTAVSPKRNTTRMKTLGVFTRHDTQIVLYDTPGILELEGAKKYERDLTAEAWDATARADVVIVLIDAVKRVGPAEHSLILKAKKWQQETNLPCILVLNKCDLEHPKTKLVSTADELMEICDFTEVYYISASLGKFVDEVQEYLFGLAKPAPWQFPANESSALTDKQRAAEIIREKIYCRLNQEIPYAVTQINEDWKDMPDGSVTISQRLLVESAVQQSILIGKKGAVINIIKEAAEKDLASILSRPVTLKLTVGVQ